MTIPPHNHILFSCPATLPVVARQSQPSFDDPQLPLSQHTPAPCDQHTPTVAIPAHVLSDIIEAGQAHYNALLRRWGVESIDPEAAHEIQMGKRRELIGDYQTHIARMALRASASSRQMELPIMREWRAQDNSFQLPPSDLCNP